MRFLEKGAVGRALYRLLSKSGPGLGIWAPLGLHFEVFPAFVFDVFVAQGLMPRAQQQLSDF